MGLTALFMLAKKDGLAKGPADGLMSAALPLFPAASPLPFALLLFCCVNASSTAHQHAGQLLAAAGDSLLQRRRRTERERDGFKI